MSLARLQRVDDGICRSFLTQFLKLAIPKEREPIIPWAYKHIDMSYDKTASDTGPLIPYPYQVEPLEATEDPDVNEISLQWGQRLGKSTIWRVSMLKNIYDGGLSGLIVYPSADLAMKMNKDTVRPLIETLPEAKKDLAIRGGAKRNSFHLPSQSSVVYFLGGGTQVISLTANWTVLDESDFVALQKSDEEGTNMSQLRALRIRMQTFRDRLLIVCSSPSSNSGVIHRNYLRGSQGEWSLRCLGCGELSPSRQLAFILGDGHYAGLQWDKNDDGDVIEDSIRWICPVCRHQHTYDDAHKMNELGEYVHKKNNIRHRSYQCGALANPKTWTWLEIAQAQEDAAIDADGKKYLANTILGVPYTHKRENATSETLDAIKKKRASIPEDAKLSCITMGIDQQFSESAASKYFCYVARAWHEDGSSYLLEAGICNSYEALEEKIRQPWLGAYGALIALCDQGGFEADKRLNAMVADIPNLWYQKGSTASTLPGKGVVDGLYVLSTNEHKLLLTNMTASQVRLLEQMYNTKLWHTSDKPNPQYEEQITNVRPNTRMSKNQNGEAFANWCTYGDRRKDYFDCERYALIALKFACYTAKPKAFVQGNKPLFWRLEILREARRMAGNEKTEKNHASV